jgi:hypothetical protein
LLSFDNAKLISFLQICGMSMVTFGSFKIYYFYAGCAHSATVNKFTYYGHTYYDLTFRTGNARLECIDGVWQTESGKKIKPELVKAIGKGIDAAESV